MPNSQFQKRHLHYQVLYEFALLEYELDLKGKAVPRLNLKEPQALLKQIRAMRKKIAA